MSAGCEVALTGNDAGRAHRPGVDPLCVDGLMAFAFGARVEAADDARWRATGSGRKLLDEITSLLYAMMYVPGRA
jgi:hypothetical protein